MLLTSFGLSLLALSGSPADPGAAPADVFAIHASTIVVGDGQVFMDGILIVEGDKIRAVGTDVEVPEGAHEIHHDGFLTAGMVAPHSTLLSPSERSDSTDPFLHQLELRHGFDHGADAVEEALEAGVTTAALTPGPQAVVGGMAAVVKTHGGTVLEPRSHMALGMTSVTADQNRYPTSYAGIVRELNARFGPDAEGPYAEARAGRLPVLIAASANHEAQRAMTLAKAHGLKGALLGPQRIGEQLETLRASGLGVVFSPVSVGQTDRTLDAMVAVAGSDVEFAFALTDARRVRFTGAALVRHGADANRVWNAMTSGGARIAGVADRVGSLERGMHADLCLWTGHPLDLESELVAVYVGGERAATPHADHVHGHDHGNDQ